MDHDAVAALLCDPTAVISDADWTAIQQHFAVCDLCVAGPTVITAAVQGELSLLRFGLDVGRSIFQPWWLGGPIVGLVITLGIMSYVFFSGGGAEPVVPTPTPAATPVATVTPTPSATPTPTPTPSPTPNPTPTLTPTPTPTPSPSPSPSVVTPTEPPAVPSPTSTPERTQRLCPATCTPTEMPLSGTATEDATSAQELFRLTNERRLQAGVAALTEDAAGALTSAAREYARFVVLSRWWETSPYVPEIHCGADCRDMYDRAIDAGYPPALVRENVLWSSEGRSAEQAFNEMVQGFHEDVRNPEFVHMGVACYHRSDPGPPEYACVQVLAGAP